MIIEKNILFVGPVPPPTHGQSIAFCTAFKEIPCRKKYLVNQDVSGKPFFMAIMTIYQAILRLIFYFLFKRIDMVYITCSRSLKGSLFDVLVLSICKMFDTVVINHIHGHDLNTFLLSLRRPIKRLIFWAYRKVDVFIVLTEQMKSQVSCFRGARIDVVPNFYDHSLEVIQEKPKHQSVRLIYLSNVMKTKGILDLLIAFKLLIEDHHDIVLNVAGKFLGDYMMAEGDIKDAFFKSYNIIKKNDEKSINYMGVTLGQEKIDLLRSSDIFILPTFYKSEAFPISILEAMRAGNVIITTRHNYLPSLISERNGILVEVRSPKAISSAIEYFLENREKMRRVQAHNMKYAKDNYPCRRYIERISAIFERM